jgi:hypothetical protein
LLARLARFRSPLELPLFGARYACIRRTGATCGDGHATRRWPRRLRERGSRYFPWTALGTDRVSAEVLEEEKRARIEYGEPFLGAGEWNR